jgi:uncharacterized damage-inducible protein DinB
MSTGLLENHRLLDRYHRWINQRLYSACDALPHELLALPAGSDCTKLI